MKFLTAPLITILVFLFSCKNENTADDASLAESQKYVINTTRDTILKTKNGALLNIRAGTIIAEKDNKVTLEIKEAYTIEQMINAKLVTRSDGEILSSGGMIYVNAAPGQQIKFAGQIAVSIPTQFIQSGMALYRGETGADGLINWVEPDTLPKSETEMKLANAKALFDSKCGTCHAIGSQKSAPDLAYFPQRFEWSEEFSQYYNHGIRGSRFETDSLVKTERPGVADTSMTTSRNIDYTEIIDYDKLWYYKCNLMARFAGSAPSTPLVAKLVSPEQEHEIYAYIKNESQRLTPPMPPQAALYSCVDSCFEYAETRKALNEKKNELSKRRSTLRNRSNAMVEQENEDSTTTNNTSSSNNTRPIDSSPLQNQNQLADQKNVDAQYYQFTIKTFGWYNIDILLKNIDGVQESELFVRVTGEYTARTQVFLVIPSHKVYVDGKPTGRNEGEFAFESTDGKLPLPQNVTAYIIALFEEDGKLGYQIQEFNITTKQQIDISVQISTVDKFRGAVRMLNFSGFELSVKKFSKIDSISVIDATLQNIDEKLNEAELLKPSGCDCDCGEEGTSPTTL